MLVVISVSHSQQEKKGKLIKAFPFTYISSRLQPQKQPASVINITDPRKKGKRKYPTAQGYWHSTAGRNISSILKMIIKIKAQCEEIGLFED